MKRLIKEENREKIKSYLSSTYDVEDLKFMKMALVIGESSADANTKKLPLLIALTLSAYNAWNATTNALHKYNFSFWITPLIIIGTTYMLYYISKGIINTLLIHADTKTQISLLDYCIEIKNNKNESKVLEIINR